MAPIAQRSCQLLILQASTLYSPALSYLMNVTPFCNRIADVAGKKLL
jgi:hypothetical protein